VIVAWLVASAVFAWYLRDVASYGSVYGALATVVVVLTYVYIASIAFLTGVQLDALVQRAGRRRAGPSPASAGTGARPRSPA
jgi:membrane protein